MSTDLKGFKAALDGFNQKVQKNFIAIHKRICLELFRRVIAKTPVDKGFLRGCWGLNIGSPMSRGDKNGSASAGKALSAEDMAHATRVLAQLSSLPAGQIVWLTNDMPYCEVVEFGLYPNPPKYGSLVTVGKKGRKAWRMRSAGGFSKQAPAGMVQVSINELRTYLEQMAGKVEDDAP